MLLKTFYRPDQDGNPNGDPQIKDIEYVIVPRISEQVIIDDVYYTVKYVVHNTDDNSIVINLNLIV